MNVRPGLSKSEPTNAAEVLKQPVFSNPLITNQDSRPLGLSGRSEGNAFVNAGHSRVGDFCDPEAKTWKNLSALGMSFHTSNRLNRDLIVTSIPWDPATSNSKPLVGDWVNKKEADQTAPPEWVYQITDTNLTTASAKEFKRSSSAGRVQATAHTAPSFPLRGTSLSESSPKTAMEPRSGSPRICSRQVRNLQSIGFLSLDSSLISRGIRGTGIGSRRATRVTLPSLDTLPREGTKMPGKNISPLASSPSSRTWVCTTRQLPRSLLECGIMRVPARLERSPG